MKYWKTRSLYRLLDECCVFYSQEGGGGDHSNDRTAVNIELRTIMAYLIHNIIERRTEEGPGILVIEEHSAG